jgi:hypothetical protein
MSPDDFLEELDRDSDAALERIAVAVARAAGGESTVARLLVHALKNELEATECAAAWIASTPAIDVKLALARQAGDGARHFRLIQKRLAELGTDTSRWEPGPRSPVFRYLASLESTVERVAAGQFTREALAMVRNDELIRFCESRGDDQTAALYQEIIQPDEQQHHVLGRILLAKLATTRDTQQRARAASKRTLDLAQEIQETARLELGVSRAPGC